MNDGENDPSEHQADALLPEECVVVGVADLPDHAHHNEQGQVVHNVKAHRVDVEERGEIVVIKIDKEDVSPVFLHGEEAAHANRGLLHRE